jgi:mRNA-degrading endonuclease RelE of RelBE toxin-antitoxin system
MYGIEWKAKALKQLFKLRNREAIIEIRQAVENLKQFPSCPNIKELKGHEYGWQLRVGRYRVLFDVYAKVCIIEIQEVKKRNERTY